MQFAFNAYSAKKAFFSFDEKLACKGGYIRETEEKIKDFFAWNWK